MYLLPLFNKIENLPKGSRVSIILFGNCYKLFYLAAQYVPEKALDCVFYFENRPFIFLLILVNIAFACRFVNVGFVGCRVLIMSV